MNDIAMNDVNMNDIDTNDVNMDEVDTNDGEDSVKKVFSLPFVPK